MLATQSSSALVFILALITCMSAALTTQNLPIAIPNSIYDECYPLPSNSSTKSDFGCGGGLNCINRGPDYSQCTPTAALSASLYQNCPVAMAGIQGSFQIDAPCALGAFCALQNENSAVCTPCRTRFVTCGMSAVDSAIGCCPEAKCTAVNATVAGQITRMEICLPVPTSTTQQPVMKRAVRIATAAPTNYCYSGCSGAKVI